MTRPKNKRISQNRPKRNLHCVSDWKEKVFLYTLFFFFFSRAILAGGLLRFWGSSYNQSAQQVLAVASGQLYIKVFDLRELRAGSETVGNFCFLFSVLFFFVCGTKNKIK